MPSTCKVFYKIKKGMDSEPVRDRTGVKALHVASPDSILGTAEPGVSLKHLWV